MCSRYHPTLARVYGKALTSTDVVSWAGVWEKIVDASFMLDIYFNFRTGYIESEPADFLVTSARTVAVRYIRGFFLIDFLSTVPWDLVLSNNGLGIFQLVKLSKLMKLLRMARALKLVRILRLIKVPTLAPLCCCFLPHSPSHCDSCNVHHPPFITNLQCHVQR